MKPTIPQTTGTSTSLFLRLPREVRDEIYNYTLKNAVTALCISDLERIYEHHPHNTPFAQDFGLPRLQTSLLLVNRQIHDEVSSFFYSRTVFPVRVIVGPADIYTYARGHQHSFLGRYIAPWEDISFEWVAGTKNGSYRTGSAVQSRIQSTYIGENDIIRYPSPRYRHLIRHVRIEIIDLSSILYPCSTWTQALHKQAVRDPATGNSYTAASIPSWKREGMNAISGKNRFDDNSVWYLRQTPTDGKVNPEEEGPRVRALLMPFACRLENILQDAGVGVKKEIRVISRPPENGYEGLEHKTAYFKELIELSYPFTRGQGEFEISTTLDTESSLTSEEGTPSYRRLVSEVLDNCSRSPGFTPDVEEGFRSIRITKGHNQGYWEIRNGNLFVGRGRSFL